MRQNEPTLMAPLPPARADFRAIHAGHASNEARIAALIAANMARLYDHLMGAGITHVAASFICDDDTYRVMRMRLKARGHGASPKTALEILAKVQRFTAYIGEKPFTETTRTKPEQLSLFEALDVSKPA